MSEKPRLGFLEFFAGGGMARLGLGEDWECLLANDFDPMKAETYRRNFFSSRQFIIEVQESRLRSRFLSAPEAARLMGLPDTYQLPENYVDVYYVVGDGLAVPVVSWLEKKLLRLVIGNDQPETPMPTGEQLFQARLLERKQRYERI